MDAFVKGAVSGCLGKVAYDDENLVYKVKRRREKATGKSLRVYHCDLAPHWHLTSTPAVRIPAGPRCGVCLEPFEPKDKSDWACVDCK